MRLNKISSFDRLWVVRAFLLLSGSVLVFRLFYVQIIHHDYYQSKALAEHMKMFEITAARGSISVMDGQGTVPVVLNEKRYTIYADPAYIDNADTTATKLVTVIGGDKNLLKKQLETKDSRYVVIAKKVTSNQADRIKKLDLRGIGKKEISIRTYPQGNLASNLLGFVNDDGLGQYGIEQYLDKQLAGVPGQEKAITDINGVPLAVNNDNVLKAAKPGDNIVLTIDLGMQKLVEDTIKKGVEKIHALRGCAIVMEANTGAVKAMASFPTYDPAQYDKVTDQSLFINTAVSMPWEPGSVFKPLVVSASLNEGASTPQTSYYDPGFVTIGDRTITNSTPWPPQTTTVKDVIDNSLNTGAVFVLKTLGGGNINEQARNTWYKYMTENYRFGKQTGIEQSYEAKGVISSPNEGYGLEVRYSNTAFGQGITVTPIQLAGAYAAIVNGGTYYKPKLVAYNADENKKNFKPEILSKNVVSGETSKQIKEMLRSALEINNKSAVRAGYVLGAKSGTAQVADENGNYKANIYNGAYVGYVGDAEGPKYILLMRIDEPKTSGFASAEAYKIWDEISNAMIDSLPFKPTGS